MLQEIVRYELDIYFLCVSSSPNESMARVLVQLQLSVNSLSHKILLVFDAANLVETREQAAKHVSYEAQELPSHASGI